jgi:translation initiation factor eIF-2B subunit delta
MAEPTPKEVPPATSVPNGTTPAPSLAAPAAQPTPEAPKLSGAELKKLAKAEKAAKRAAQKLEGAPGPSQQGGPSKDAAKGPKKTQQQTPKGRPQQKPLQKDAIVMPSSGPTHTKSPSKAESVPNNRHFKQFSVHRRTGIEGAHKDVHSAVLAYGLQVSSYQICGSTARCIGMLQAFRAVIKSYVIPQDTALARHFIPHVLSPQIEFIKSCRPTSVGMGNAIRDFKDAIVKIDPETSETEAKQELYDMIDIFIRERITAADALIMCAASDKIVNGDVILTYARSSIIERTLREAQKIGKKFRVIVVDSKPLYEGKKLAQSLAADGIAVDYYLIAGIAHAIGEATKVFVGAHAMMGDGRLYSRIGTAVVAMVAKDRNVPLIVCCESYKFTDRVYVDSFGGNELAPPEELLEDPQEREAWRQSMEKRPLLQMLNLMYDLTPAEYVNMIVTEHGNLPPSSVPAVLRMLEGKMA